MGMFDYVCIKVVCPVCGKEMSEFQTKDTDCTMDYILPGESFVDSKRRYLNTYSYCDHEWATIKRFDEISDSRVNNLWMDVQIPINKNGLLSKDIRKYNIEYEEHLWDAKKMASAPYPTYTLDPSEEVLKRNKEIWELRNDGPYDAVVTINVEEYDTHVKAQTQYLLGILDEIERKTKERDEYCKERKILPKCDNCIYIKNDRCHLLENIPGVNIDFTNDLPENRVCCDWKEKDIQTEW